MLAVVVAVLTLSAMHALLGLLNFFLGIAASVQADVWVAHTVSPIWSGIFFMITGCLGFVCAKRKTAYMILCFTAFSIVSLVTAVVSIQLLRLGLVDRTSDGKTYKKEKADKTIVGALVVTSIECLVCVISAFVSCRMAKAAKKAMEQKRDGTFHIQANGQLDLENNNMCVVYTVGKGYHNSLLAADNPNSIIQQSVHMEEEFTDLATLQDQCDSDWNYSQDDLNSSRNSLNESQISTGKPFQTYLRPEMASTTYRAHKTSDAKTVTFCPEADQIVHLSPTRSVTSSPSIHGSNENTYDQRAVYEIHASRRLDKRLSANPVHRDSEIDESMETKSDAESTGEFHLSAHSQVDSTIPEVETLCKRESKECATNREPEFDF